jgi:hypothetical protein
MRDYLNDLKEAFHKVPTTYLKDTVEHLGEPVKNTQGIERPFMAELYHQWRIIIEDNPNRYRNLNIHAELGKRLLANQFIEYPDIVLHGGQTGEYRNQNKLFLEIKMTTFCSNDLRKILVATSNLQYQVGVYAIVNASIETLKSGLRDNNKLCLEFKNTIHKLFFLTKSDGIISFKDLDV